MCALNNEKICNRFIERRFSVRSAKKVEAKQVHSPLTVVFATHALNMKHEGVCWISNRSSRKSGPANKIQFWKFLSVVYSSDENIRQSLHCLINGLLKPTPMPHKSLSNFECSLVPLSSHRIASLSHPHPRKRHHDKNHKHKINRFD